MNPVSANLVMPQSLGQKGYNEFWNYHFYLDQDIRLHVTFSMVDFGSLKAPVSGIRISVQNFDGRTWQVSREYPIERLTLDQNRYRVRLHPERNFYFEGKLPEAHRLAIDFTKDGISYNIHLEFSDIQPGMMWGDGHYGVRDGGLTIVTHIPYARVSGHIQINEKKLNVSGTAYMDHTWQFESSVRMIHSAYKFIHHGSADNWEILYFILPQARGEHQTVGHRISNHNGSIRHYGINRIVTHQAERVDGKSVFNRMVIGAAGGGQLELRRTENREIHPTFGELSWIARRGIRSLLGGEVIDYRGRGVLIEDGVRYPGEYNFILID